MPVTQAYHDALPPAAQQIRATVKQWDERLQALFPHHYAELQLDEPEWITDAPFFEDIGQGSFGVRFRIGIDCGDYQVYDIDSNDSTKCERDTLHMIRVEIMNLQEALCEYSDQLDKALASLRKRQPA